MQKVYQSHMHNSRLGFINDFENAKLNKDRFYMGEMIKPTIRILDNSGVTNYQDFYQLFKRRGLKSKDIIYLINEFKEWNNKQEQIRKIDWIKKRELNKSNCGEKNIILNRLASEYPERFTNFIHSYINMMVPSSNNEIFISEFKFLISEVEKQKQLNFFLKHFK